MFRSLRSRLVLASILWTSGLLLLMHLASLAFIHSLPGLRGVDPHWPVAAALLAMGAGAVAARAGLTSLRRIGGRVAAVSLGDASRIEGSYPSEVQPLVDRVNALLQDREKATARAYAVAGDLAHSLKTPLALLTHEGARARALGHVELADAIASQVRRMSAQIDRHLARTRVAAAGPVSHDRCEVASCAAALVRTVSTIYAERALGISCDVPPALEAHIRREDLEEILGNLLDNACKWGRTTVELTVEAGDGTVIFVIDDDGPGIAAVLRDKVLQRGVRADEGAPGSGLGLSIVRDLTEHYGGSLALDRSPLGGLRVRVTLAGGRQADGRGV